MELRILHARLLASERRIDEACATWLAAADAASQVGWQAAEHQCYIFTLQHAFPAGRLVVARESAQRLHALQVATQDAEGLAASGQDLAQIGSRMGDLAAARRRMEEAVALFSELGLLERAESARRVRLIWLALAGQAKLGLAEARLAGARQLRADSASATVQESASSGASMRASLYATTSGHAHGER